MACIKIKNIVYDIYVSKTTDGEKVDSDFFFVPCDLDSLVISAPAALLRSYSNLAKGLCSFMSPSDSWEQSFLETSLLTKRIDSEELNKINFKHYENELSSEKITISTISSPAKDIIFSRKENSTEETSPPGEEESTKEPIPSGEGEPTNKDNLKKKRVHGKI